MKSSPPSRDSGGKTSFITQGQKAPRELSGAIRPTNRFHLPQPVWEAVPQHALPLRHPRHHPLLHPCHLFLHTATITWLASGAADQPMWRTIDREILIARAVFAPFAPHSRRRPGPPQIAEEVTRARLSGFQPGLLRQKPGRGTAGFLGDRRMMALALPTPLPFVTSLLTGYIDTG